MFKGEYYDSYKTEAIPGWWWVVPPFQIAVICRSFSNAMKGWGKISGSTSDSPAIDTESYREHEAKLWGEAIGKGNAIRQKV